MLINIIRRSKNMREMLEAIDEVSTNHKALEDDFRYLAWCYVHKSTDFELPMTDIDVMCDFSYLMRGVKRHIAEMDSSCVVDEVELMSYLDYYYQFINDCRVLDK